MRMYFAADGNYGAESGMSVVNVTDEWADGFWDILEMVSDEYRPAFAYEYAMYVGSFKDATARARMHVLFEELGIDLETGTAIL